MKESIKSFILLLIITIILGALLVLGLDVFGIIILPEKYSIKKYINYNNSETVMLISENIISYPKEYYIVNQSKDNSVSNKVKNNTTYNSALVSLVENNNNNIFYDGIMYGANKTYYYNQLDVYGKTLYNELYKNIDNLKTGTYTVDYGAVFNELLNTPDGEKVLTDAFQLSINAMLLDHPEIFYLDVTKMYMYTEINKTIWETTYEISIGPEEGTNYLQQEFNNKDDVLLAEAEINTIAYTITSKFDGDTYDKIKQAHDYLVDTLKYDESGSRINSHNIYGALVNEIVVCDGYAKTYKFLLDYMGIHCVQICGTAINSLGVSENHTWNYVFLDDSWYAVDTTWDDPIIIGGGKLTGSLKYKNFLCGSEVFFENHTENGYIVENGCFDYPILNKNNYL